MHYLQKLIQDVSVLNAKHLEKNQVGLELNLAMALNVARCDPRGRSKNKIDKLNFRIKSCAVQDAIKNIGVSILIWQA